MWHRVSEVPGGGVKVKRPKIGNPNPPLEAAEKGVLTEENRVVEKNKCVKAQKVADGHLGTHRPQGRTAVKPHMHKGKPTKT